VPPLVFSCGHHAFTRAQKWIVGQRKRVNVFGFAATEGEEKAMGVVAVARTNPSSRTCGR
jgi:hypothetical protein